MKSILLLFSLLLISHFSFSQFTLDWASTIAGGTNSFGWGQDVGPNGDVAVTGKFRGTLVDFDPGPGVASLSSGGANDDPFVALYDSNGNYKWAIGLGSTQNLENGEDVVIDSAGNVYATGYFRGVVDFDPGPGVFDLAATGAGTNCYVAKYSSTGNLVWAFQINDARGHSIALDNSNNICVFGDPSPITDYDPGSGVSLATTGGCQFLAKYDSSGTFMWVKEIIGGSLQPLPELVVDQNNDIIITGGFSGSVDFDPGPAISNLNPIGNVDMFLAKYDGNGNYQWAFNIGGTGPGSQTTVGYEIDVDQLGNIYLVGEYDDTTDFDPGTGIANQVTIGNGEGFLVKYDPSGIYQWSFVLAAAPGEFTDIRGVRAGNGEIYISGDFEEQLILIPD